MGLFDFFKKKKNSQNEEKLISSNRITHKLYSGIFVFNHRIDELLKQDSFIARSDYKNLIIEYKDLYNSLLPIYNNNLISDFSKKYNVKISEINRFSNLYKEIQKQLANDVALYPICYSKSVIGVDKNYDVQGANLAPIFMFRDLNGLKIKN